MESFKKLLQYKRLVHFIIVLTTIAGIIIILSILQKEKVITEQEKQEIEAVAVGMLAIQLEYIDGQYQVDKNPKKFYLDLT